MSNITKYEQNLVDIFAPEKGGFAYLDDSALEKIIDRMPEITRATKIFGRKNSQWSLRNMTMTMISDSPYRRLRQCLAEIDHRRKALRDAYYSMQREKLEIEKIKDALNSEDISQQATKEGQYKQQLLRIDLEEKTSKIADTVVYIEGALKEIFQLQQMYAEIKKSHNISDDWDEDDFERGEHDNHVRLAFRQSIRDVIAGGVIGFANQEYLEQCGINPIDALKYIRAYLSSNPSGYDALEAFLSAMALRYAESDQIVAQSIGLGKTIEWKRR